MLRSFAPLPFNDFMRICGPRSSMRSMVCNSRINDFAVPRPIWNISATLEYVKSLNWDERNFALIAKANDRARIVFLFAIADFNMPCEISFIQKRCPGCDSEHEPGRVATLEYLHALWVTRCKDNIFFANNKILLIFVPDMRNLCLYSFSSLWLKLAG